MATSRNPSLLKLRIYNSPLLVVGERAPVTVRVVNGTGKEVKIEKVELSLRDAAHFEPVSWQLPMSLPPGDEWHDFGGWITPDKEGELLLDIKLEASSGSTRSIGTFKDYNTDSQAPKIISKEEFASAPDAFVNLLDENLRLLITDLPDLPQQLARLAADAPARTPALIWDQAPPAGKTIQPLGKPSASPLAGEKRKDGRGQKFNLGDLPPDSDSSPPKSDPAGQPTPGSISSPVTPLPQPPKVESHLSTDQLQRPTPRKSFTALGKRFGRPPAAPDSTPAPSRPDGPKISRNWLSLFIPPLAVAAVIIIGVVAWSQWQGAAETTGTQEKTPPETNKMPRINSFAPKTTVPKAKEVVRPRAEPPPDSAVSVAPSTPSLPSPAPPDPPAISSKPESPPVSAMEDLRKLSTEFNTYIRQGDENRARTTLAKLKEHLKESPEIMTLQIKLDMLAETRLKKDGKSYAPSGDSSSKLKSIQSTTPAQPAGNTNPATMAPFPSTISIGKKEPPIKSELAKFTSSDVESFVTRYYLDGMKRSNYFADSVSITFKGETAKHTVSDVASDEAKLALKKKISRAMEEKPKVETLTSQKFSAACTTIQTLTDLADSSESKLRVIEYLTVDVVAGALKISEINRTLVTLLSSSSTASGEKPVTTTTISTEKKIETFVRNYLTAGNSSEGDATGQLRFFSTYLERYFDDTDGTSRDGSDGTVEADLCKFSRDFAERSFKLASIKSTRSLGSGRWRVTYEFDKEIWPFAGKSGKSSIGRAVDEMIVVQDGESFLIKSLRRVQNK